MQTTRNDATLLVFKMQAATILRRVRHKFVTVIKFKHNSTQIRGSRHTCTYVWLFRMLKRVLWKRHIVQVKLSHKPAIMKDTSSFT